MKRLLFALLAMSFAGLVYAATLESDITAQGGHSYFLKNISDSQFATMIRDYETLTAADTLLYTECGKTVFLNSATEFATTLPSPVAGCQFTFYVKAAPAGANYTVVTAGGSNVIYGSLVVDGAAVPCVTEDTINVVQAAAAIGDSFKLEADGTNWYVSGDGEAVGSLTCTAT
jgi:hypothetical protein